MRAFFAYVALTALTLAVFALRPDLDLAVAHLFYDRGGFLGHDALDKFGRDFFRVTPFVVLAAFAALWLLKRLGRWSGWAPSGRAMIFLIATIAIGPGAVVNLALKDHWHRPRPIQTQDFHGPYAFKPWYDDQGACKKNCSFVSGEAATGFWMVAPTVLVPPPFRVPAIVAAFAFGIAASLLRMAFGGHYLSDVLLGGLVTLIIVEIARMLFWPLGADPSGSEIDGLCEGNRGQTAAEVVAAALAPASVSFLGPGQRSGQGPGRRAQRARPTDRLRGPRARL